MRFALLFLLLPALAWAKPCAEEIVPGSTLVFSASTYRNLIRLREVESIDPAVRRRYDVEVLAVAHAPLREQANLAAAYAADPSERRRTRLFEAMRLQVPIAVRPLLHRLNDPADLEDLFQVGYAALWKHISRLPRLEAESLANVFFFDVSRDYTRRWIFSQMRAEYRRNYSITPVPFPKMTGQSFEEDILLYGDTPEERARLAKQHGKDAFDAEREYYLQQWSIGHNEQDGEAETREDMVEAAENAVRDEQAKAFVNRMLRQLPPRHERVVRERFYFDLTFQQIADKMGLSAMRINDMTAQALRRMKKPHQRAWRGLLINFDSLYDAIPESSPREPRNEQSKALKRGPIPGVGEAERRENLWSTHAPTLAEATRLHERVASLAEENEDEVLGEDWIMRAVEWQVEINRQRSRLFDEGNMRDEDLRRSIEAWLIQSSMALRDWFWRTRQILTEDLSWWRHWKRFEEVKLLARIAQARKAVTSLNERMDDGESGLGAERDEAGKSLREAEEQLTSTQRTMLVRLHRQLKAISFAPRPGEDAPKPKREPKRNMLHGGFGGGAF